MKKNYLVLILLFAFFSANAQNESESNPFEKKNDITINAIAALNKTLNISYERHFNNKSSLGVYYFHVLANDTSNDMNYSISPYYRRYFGKKYASGFFAEGFGMLTSIDGKKVYTSEDHSTYTENPDVIDFALGAGGGWKWASKSGFIFEANVGYGFLLFNANKTDHNIVAKFGLSAGYRF
ncbi:DUF3575 domain-containing protein [Flavobacterium sp. LHD-85]|uniref:DUF3575 domain-containing protein n=1 Tax=Flavobacterium sp. LHD-85 TaxID=3071410 RepID=UPI0027DED8A2|nr:DUF3575 domain-containing protein [Flavobacterium sp. LHD-85]MDQ6527700.1 DUF3575 domain-containing protein [Flavobacterium sp. LHD-85]